VSSERWTIYVYPDGQRSMAQSKIPGTRSVEVGPLAEVERLRGLLAHFRNRLLVYAPLADDMIAEMDAALAFDPCGMGREDGPDA
jgi:hypothetical protein